MIITKLEADLTNPPGFTGTPVWENLSNRVLHAEIDRGRNTELDRYEVGTLQALLYNKDGLLNPSVAPPAGVGSSYSQAVLANAPTAYWRLGEAAGATTCADQSGHSNALTPTNVTFGVAGALGAILDPDTAGSLNGTTSYLTSGVSAGLAGASVTVMGFGWRNNTTAQHYLFGNDTNGFLPGILPFAMAIASGSEDVSLTQGAHSNATATWAAAWPGTAQWVHWAISVNGSAQTAELFINGVSKGVISFAGPSINPLILGSYINRLGTRVGFFDGILDEVAVFPGALSGAAITNIYNASVNSSSGTRLVLPGRKVRIKGVYTPNVCDPSLYWALDEAAGATVAKDSSGNGRSGAIDAGITLGVAGGTVDGSTAATFANSNTSRVSIAAYSPFVAGAQRTLMGWAKRTATTDADTFFSTTTAGPILQAVAATTDVIFKPDGATAVTWTAAIPTAAFFHWALTIDDAAHTAELWVNGVSKGIKVIVAITGNNPLELGAFGAAAGTAAWAGQMQHFAVFERKLTQNEIIGVSTGQLTGFTEFVGYSESWNPARIPGSAGISWGAIALTVVDVFAPLALGKHSQNRSAELSNVRVGAMLDAAGWSAADRSISTGLATVAAVVYNVYGVLQTIYDCEDAENGYFFCTRDGLAKFQNRYDRATGVSASVATFSDVQADLDAGTAFPYYVDGADIEFSNALIYNDIQVTSTQTGQTSEEQSVVSSGTYFLRTLAKNVPLQTNSDADNLALYLLNNYSIPVLRINKILLMDTANNGQSSYHQLARDIGDRITVKCTLGGGFVVSADYTIEHIHHVLDGETHSWTTEWALVPANTQTFWILDSGLYSVLDSTTRLAF